MTESTDVVVVGAGVIGSSIALELARSGLRVVVVDKFGGAGNGFTSASSAVVRFTYPTIAGDAAWESLHCWEAWRDHRLNTPNDQGSAGLVNGLPGVGAHRRGLLTQRAGAVLPAGEVLVVAPVQEDAGGRDQARLPRRLLAVPTGHGRRLGSCWRTRSTRSCVGFQAGSAPVAGTGSGSSWTSARTRW